MQYVIKNLRTSGFKNRFHLPTTSSIKSIKIDKFRHKEEIRHKIIALRQAKFSDLAVCQQLNLKNPSTISNSFAAVEQFYPNPSLEDPKNFQNEMKEVLNSILRFQPGQDSLPLYDSALCCRHDKLIGRRAAKQLMLRTKKTSR